VCEVNFPMTFGELLWVRSSLMTREDETNSGSRNVVWKFTSHTVQKTLNQKSIFSEHIHLLCDVGTHLKVQ
jgi:hypothetical protein